MDYYERKQKATELIIKLNENKIPVNTIKLNVLTSFGFDGMFTEKVLLLLKEDKK